MRKIILLCLLLLSAAPAAFAQRAYSDDVGELRILAEGGDAEAQYKLGILHYEGRGVKKNDAEAAKWIRKAAGKCHEEAQAAMGLLYYNGEGVEKDQTEALKWFMPLAEAGRAEAQIGVATMHLEGNGTARNPAEAYFWTLLAARQIEEGGALRDQIKPHLSAEERTAAQKRAEAWKPKAQGCQKEET